MSDKVSIINEILDKLKNNEPRKAGSLLFNENYLWIHDGSLRGQSFVGIDLSGAAPSRVDFSDVDLSDSDCYEIDFHRSILRNTIFVRTNLQGSLFNECDMRLAVFTDANMQGSSISQSIMEAAHFERSDLSGAVVQSDAPNAFFGNANLEEVKFVGCDFRGASFLGAKMRNTLFKYCILDEETIMPNGSYWNETINMSIFGTTVIKK